MGNMLSSVIPSEYIATMTYGPTSAVATRHVTSISYAATTFSYDANGNRTVANTNNALTTFAWDYENRLSGIAYPTGHILTNLYSADGIRQGYSDSVTGVTTLTYDPLTLNLHRRDVSVGGTTDRYTAPPQMYATPFMAHNSSAGNEMYLPDLSGNNLGIWNGSSQVAQYLYTTFGVPIYTSASVFQPNQFGAAWQYYADPSSGMIYVKARWLDSFTGQWVSKDPIGFDGGDWEGLYGFVGNNPVTRIDALGLSTGRELIQISSLFSAVTAADRVTFPTQNSAASAPDLIEVNPDTKCLSAPSAPSSSPDCNAYGTATYPGTGTNLQCFCKCAGDSAWADEVRGCLACMYANNINIEAAHILCYAAASSNHTMPVSTIAKCFALCTPCPRL
jgi:RHS repeat-associated protein